ncbi:MAG: hypothetical protein NNA20_06095 [Nitrospira sp.]|nr:hypothetical protein [Nitrospira sp.]MCP9442146.1 hypothetical protein [Nitrospira sp.]
MKKTSLRFHHGLCIVALVVGCTTPATFSIAQDDLADRRLRVEVGLGTWLSVGETTWSHNASVVSPFGNPTSRLTYEDHSANVVELTAKVRVGPRWFGQFNIGGARIGGGRLTDDDFLVQDGGNPSLRTHSDIDGSGLWYLNMDVGAQVLEFHEGRGSVEAMGGFQYWRQRHRAFGVRQVSCSAAGASIDLDPVMPGVNPLCVPGASPISSGVLAISNTNTWYSLRTGVHADYRLVRWLSLRGSIIVKPINFFTNDDTHHLRVPSEFQDPSFTMRGIGFGADADVTATVSLTSSFSGYVGYRVWWNRLIDGTWKGHQADGRSFSYPLTEMESLRHGLTAGILYRF